MLESCFDQGAGLRLHMPQAVPRLAALVGHGDTDTELPLLWQLCDALLALGYRVAVLDASTTETQDSPGLHGLLDGSLAAEDGFDIGATAPAQELAVFPARLGIDSLTHEDRTPRPGAASRLARALRAWDIAVLFGPAEVLASWSQHCAIAPVLATAPRQDGVLAAWRSLKELLDAGVVPTIASVVTRPGIATAGSAQAARDNLQRCAQSWLGHSVDVLRVRAAPEGAPASGEIHRLALRLIEGAANLTDTAARFDRPARSH